MKRGCAEIPIEPYKLIWLLTAALTFALSQPGFSQPAKLSQTWLDTKQPDNWNLPDAEIPKAPTSTSSADNLQGCKERTRSAATAEDKALVTAGWTLIGPIQIYGDTSVRTAMSNADGMCRPLGYQVFVFVDGQFAGTLAPKPMNSRTDGYSNSIYLTGETALSLEFRRYGAGDALCCPSRTSTVSYQIREVNGQPVVMPVNVFTQNN